MKKILLSISILAAVITASAQNFTLYDAATMTSPFNGTAFTFNDNITFTVDTATSAPHTITAAGTAGTGAYYISGFGNAKYGTSGGESIGYPTTNFSTDKFFMNIFTNGHAMKVKVQFSTFTTPGTKDADVYGYEFAIPAGAPATSGFADVSVNLSSFSKIVSNNPDNTNFLTAAIAQYIGQIEFAIILDENGGTGPGEVQIRNMTIGSSSVISGVKKQSPVSDLSIAPNPSSDLTVVKYSSPSETVVSVSDLRGNVVKTVNGSRTDASINTSDMASGIYVVTVNVDGIPSVPRKLVVK